MSEFIKVLDRINENLQNGQPMFDGIEYLAGAQWVPALALNDTPQLY